jgi:SpoVK/Ycf46/Vps4 family AAA+-type ATPase
VNDLDPDQAQQDMGELAGLPGLETVREQLAGAIAVVRAEQARRDAGVAVSRPARKNMVFTGDPGSGKSRAAAAVARVYRALGVLSSGHLTEVAGQDLAGSTSRETGRLVREAASRARGGVLLITDAHAYAGLRSGDQQVLRCLQEVLTEQREDLVVILAGQADQLRSLLDATPTLASRFPAAVDFPGYTAAQLAQIFATLAGEAGFTLTPGGRKSGRCCTRPGTGRPGGRQRPAGCLAAGPGHRQPGPPDHNRAPVSVASCPVHDQRR